MFLKQLVAELKVVLQIIEDLGREEERLFILFVRTLEEAREDRSDLIPLAEEITLKEIVVAFK